MGAPLTSIVNGEEIPLFEDDWQVELPGIGIVDLRPQTDLRQQQTPINWSEPAPSKMRKRDIPAAAAKQVYNQLLEPAAETSLMFGTSIAGEVAAIPGIVGQAMNPEEYAERGYQTAGEVRDAVVDKVAYKPQGEATHAGLEVVNGAVTFMGEQLLPLREGYENTMNPLIGEKAAGAIYAGLGALAFVAPGAAITAPGRAARGLGRAAGNAANKRFLAKEAEGMAKSARADNVLAEPPRLTGPASRDVPTPKPMTGQVDQQMTNALRLANTFPAQRGGPAWHGTPFSRLDKIPKGSKTDNILDIFHPANAYSGEGNHAFGYTPVGYFSESPGVAKSYQIHLSQGYRTANSSAIINGEPFDVFKKNLPENERLILESALNDSAEGLQRGWFDDLEWGDEMHDTVSGKIRYTLKDEVNGLYGEDGMPLKFTEAEANSLINKLESVKFKENPGHLMEVDFDDAAVSRMLDWDAPLSEQPESVRAVLEELISKDVIHRGSYTASDGSAQFLDPTKMDGAQLYEALVTSREVGSKRAASELLQEAGIPGIRYYDGASRGKGEGTRNIVPFDPDIINWVKRDGETIFEKPSNNELRGPKMPEKGGKLVPVKSRMDAERHWEDPNVTVYAINEMDEIPSEVTSLDMLNAYAPDQLYVAPKGGLLGEGTVTNQFNVRNSLEERLGLEDAPEPKGTWDKEVVLSDDPMRARRLRAQYAKEGAPDEVLKTLDDHIKSLNQNSPGRGPGFRQRGSIDNTKTKGVKKTAAKVAVTNAMRKKGTVVESSRPQPTVKNALAGLTPSPEAAAARLGRKIKRQNLPAEKRPGQRVNKRKVLKAKGQPDFVVGELTFDDWIKRAESLLTKGEIKKARLWYKEIHDTFKPFFGKATDQVVAAFLIANKNVSPAGALANALRAREQLLTGAVGKKAGLNHDALMKLFRGESIEKGVGQKLYDFVDSQAGKTTRSFYGNNALAGEPTVVDVHTARDAGYVDVPLLNVLKDKGYNVSGVKPDFKYDAAKKTSGAPSETQYENAGDWLRELTGDLNTRGYAGGNWTGSETQAVGWVALSKFTGARAEDSLATISKNISRVSFELAPGRGSPAAAKYGEQFSELSVAKQKQITKKTLKGVSSWVADQLKIASFDMVAGTGGWMKATNPSLVNHVLASKETAELSANMIGYLAQQEQVWVNRLKPMTANPKAFGITLAGKDMGKSSFVDRFWKQILEKDKTDLIQGYQPIVNEDGIPGILVLIDKGGKKTKSAIENEIRIMLEEMASVQKGDIIAQVSAAEIYKAGVEGGYDGQAYLEGVQRAGREDLIPALRNYRGKLEKDFGTELEKVKGVNALRGKGQ